MEIKLTAEDLAKKKLFIATPMFGGLAAGMYTKSMCDLSAVCTRYGIELQYFALFNESLICRARNYCVDEFLRSKMDYFLFIDADIGFDPGDIVAMLGMMTPESPYDVLCAPYPKKTVCLPSYSIINTEDGPKTIKNLVDSNYRGKVLTLGENGKFSYENVTNAWKTKRDGKPWIKLNTDKNITLTCTEDHLCQYTDNIFYPELKWDEAQNLLEKFIIRYPSGGRNETPLFNQDQMSVMIGTLFGDGMIRKDGVFAVKHGDKQKEYLDFKKWLFNGKIIETTGGYDNIAYYMWAPMNAQSRYIRKDMYSSGKKSIKNYIDKLDEKGLLFWYLDDGNYSKPRGKGIYKERIDASEGTVSFSTHSFTLEDIEIIREYFIKKWNIDTYKYNVRKDQWVIKIASNSTKIFFELIVKYVPTELVKLFKDYKIPSKFFSDLQQYSYNNKNLEYSAAYVNKIEILPPNHNKGRSDLYDITVENTHNFIADGFIVHNCWEKIVQAVNKGMADENPNTLDKYVGDFVFNPKSNQNQIAINEPCEILEGGTGFMMIRRATFEKFQKAFPHYMYRPDHVRTEHFDGSRQICQFFQAEIDAPDSVLLKERIKKIIDSGGSKEDIQKEVDDFEKKLSTASNRYLSEDYWFSQKIQELGMKIWLCPWMKTSHMGNMIYGGSLADLASIGASPTAEVSLLKKAKQKQ